MKLKKFFAIGLSVVMATTATAALAACGSDDKIVIWTSGEDYKNNFYLNELKEKFPEYSIELEYMNTSTIAAKITAEGDRCTADIILSEEYGYLMKCEQYFVELSDFDYSIFLDDLVEDSHKFTPELKNGGCIVVNKAILDSKGLDVPQSYQDLLDSKYKGLISMPNPASSGTGYMFLRQLTNEWGEDIAFEWFKAFKNNVLQFTSSGSGPVNQLKQGEVAIGLCMTAQAVTEINDGVDLDILFFEEGSPYSLYGSGVLKKSAEKVGVMEVFNYLAIDLCEESNKRFFPEQIFKDLVPTIVNYPTNIKYGNMTNDTISEKERLLKRWSNEGIA